MGSPSDSCDFTRRRYLTAGVGAVGSGLIAGCTGESAAPESGVTDSGDSYTVDTEPAGTVEFDAIPETWVAEGGAWVDMGLALGVEDGLLSTGSYPAPQLFYDEVDASIDRDASVNFWNDGGYDKEVFYETDADVHLLDPNAIKYWDDSWDDDDIEEISQAVGPICGNNCRRRRSFGEELDYPLYSLYEAFEVVAAVFQQRDRYEAFERLHDEFIESIQTRLPPESERPEVFLTERAAKRLYSDTFGDVTGDTELFDRQRVANIVTGKS